MPTLSDVMTDAPVEIPAHLEADMEIPVLGGFQAQGDLLVVPTKAKITAERVHGSVTVLAGQHNHVLTADGDVRFSERGGKSRLAIGVVEVADGSVGYLLHAEHGASGLAPGRYELRRKREQAEEERLVAD